MLILTKAKIKFKTMANSTDSTKFLNTSEGLLKADPANWMSKLPDSFTLSEVCMPGSHDSGMYKFTASIGKALGSMDIQRRLSQTHKSTILEQLNSGIRYYDLRPIRYSLPKVEIYHEYFAYHTPNSSTPPLLATPGLGGRFKEIFSDIKKFMNQSQETVFLEITHYNFDAEYRDEFVKFLRDNLGQWMLTKAEVDNRAFADIPLSDLRGKIVTIFETSDGHNNVMPDSFLESQNDIFIKKTEGTTKNGRDFKSYDSYANAQNYEDMFNDQKNKFDSLSASDSLFLLCWTLTAKCEIVDKNPIDDIGGFDFDDIGLNNIGKKIKDFTGKIEDAVDFVVEGKNFVLWDIEYHAGEINPKIKDADFVLYPNSHGKIINVLNMDYLPTPFATLDTCEKVIKNYQKTKTS